MALVPAICTQCGAQIKVDDTNDAGICKYCGTAFVTEKVIYNNTTNNITNNNFAGANISINKSDADNFIELAKISYEGLNFDDTYKYANKALEIDAKKSLAWAYKCISLFDELDNSEIDNIELCLNKALEYAEENSKTNIEKIVYDGLILMLYGCIYSIHDYFMQLKIYSKNDENHQARNQCWETIDKIVQLRLKVPDEYMSICDEREIGMLCEMAQFDIEMCERDRSLLKYINMYPTDDAISAKYNDAKSFVKGLDESYINDIDFERIKNGCYIATCVYGSYDCPEVWVLRRFRDNTLDNFWLGRAFIKLYYAISPKVVRVCGKQKLFVFIWKHILDKYVSHLKNKGVDDTIYKDKY